MLNKTIDLDRDIQLVESPLRPGAAMLAITHRNGETTTKFIGKEDAMRLARELEAYALGE